MPRKIPEPSTNIALQELINGLRRSSVSPNIYGYRPMDHQKELHASPAWGRAMIGGNRLGKTVFGGAEMVYWVRGEHPFQPTPPPPIRARVVASDIPQGVFKIALPAIAKLMPPSSLINNSWEDSYVKQTNTLTLENDSFIEFLSNEQDLVKHAGTSRHIIWFDEEPAQDIFTENMARLIDVGGRWILTETPINGISSWIFEEIWEKSTIDANIKVVTGSMDDNIYLSKTEIDLALSTMSEEDREIRRHGKFVPIGGLVYPHFDPAKNIIPPLYKSDEWSSIKNNWTHVMSMDSGFTNPTCFHWAAIGPDRQTIIYDEHYVTGKTVEWHAEEVAQKCRALGVNPILCVGDPAIAQSNVVTGTSVHGEYAQNGINIMLGNNDVIAGINLVSRRLASGQLIICSNCTETLREFSKYRWAKWATRSSNNNNNRKETPVKKDDHAMDSIRYLIASLVDTMVDLEQYGDVRAVRRGMPEPRTWGEPRVDDLIYAESKPSGDYHMGDEY